MDYTIKHDNRMICASAEAEERTYDKHIDRDGRIWLVARQDNAGDNIYCEGSGEGFGGRLITFKLANGGSIALKGPWHTNSQALYMATGVDVRDKHTSWGVIAASREGDTYRGVIHLDREWVVGHHDRIERLAKSLAVLQGCRMHYYKQTAGGSVQSTVG